MRVLIFHGYLLRGTGSNVYNASLARALVDLGHEVHLFCQDREARALPWVDAVGSWDSGTLAVEVLREPVRCTVYRPPIGRVLPVYVADRYEGFDAKPFEDLTDAELDAYLGANVRAVQDAADRAAPDAALANHLVMGPAVLARAGLRYAVKIHGSALEYTVKRNPDRFLPYAREGLAGAAGVLVGSRHTAESLWDAMADPELPARTRLGPPGVDVHAFRPRPPDEATARLRALADRLERQPAADWGGDAGAAAALRRLDPAQDRLVSYVGKLIVSKGVDLLLAAWPLVVAQVPEARLVVVGFGEFRPGLESLVDALARADLEAAREIARRGRALEGGQESELTHLAAFIDGLEGQDRKRWLATAPEAAARVHFTGRLEHADLPELLPGCEAQVVPSTFPEAFGMVAVEAAACGALPLSAAHSGLAEVTRALKEAVEPELAPLLEFARGPGAVEEIAAKLVRWLTLEPGRRAGARASLSELARARYGWESVAEGVIAASRGELDGLPRPAVPPSEPV
ncbi:MAG TPA: glycosyltransferase family 4 protein [Thermoleophilaceae bacterium]|nr:glycosyltransferase family 4 protein [Thermoleophilaceae bacterium]